jgi:hypothetical protein
MPSAETEFLLIQIFGRKSYPMLKFLRMKLWFTRFKNINPYPVPRDLPQDPLDLAKLGLRHMEPDLSAKVTVYQVCIPVYMSLPSLAGPYCFPGFCYCPDSDRDRPFITTVGPVLVYLLIGRKDPISSSCC